MSLTNLLSLLGTPHYHALNLILASAAALQCLIAIWAATSRHHWFLRALVVWAAVLALVPIRVYEPALIFAFSSPLTVALIALLVTRVPSGNAQTRESSLAESPAPHVFRFTVRDLFLLMIIAGLALSGVLHLLRKIPHPSITNNIASIAALTLLTTAAWAAIFSRHARAWKLAFPILIASFALALPWILIATSDYDVWQLLGIRFIPQSVFGGGGIVPSTFWIDFRILLLFLGEFSFLLLLVLATASGFDLFTPTFRRAAAGLAVVLLALIGSLYCQMLFLTPLPPRFSDSPTSFDRLAEISGQLKHLLRPMNPTWSQQEQDALVAEALSLTAEANHIPFDPDNRATWRLGDEGWLNRPAIRDLARVIDSAAVTAFAKGDESKAIELFRTNIRLGTMLQRGSLIPDSLVGIAIHQLAIRSLAPLRGRLSDEAARQLISAWDESLADCEDTAAILRRDRAAAERVYGWGSRLTNILDAWGLTSELYAYNGAWSARRRDTPIRLLQTDLAIRLYDRQRGQLPKNLADLVPTYLPAIPIDPYSQLPLIYRPTADGEFTLYSVGLDAIDNGGNFTTAAKYFSRDYFGNFVTGYDQDLDRP